MFLRGQGGSTVSLSARFRSGLIVTRQQVALAYLAVAFSIWAVISIVALATNVWDTEQGAQGPIILATGLLFVVRHLRAASPSQTGGSPYLSGILAIIASILFFVGFAFHVVQMQYLSIILMGATIVQTFLGVKEVKNLWFVLVYLCFAVPMPTFLVQPIISALKLALSDGAVRAVAATGIEAANSGNRLFVDQYEVSVEDACSGINSLISLIAISTLYIYVRYAGKWRAAVLLLVFVPPIAIGSNILRIIGVLVAVHIFGARALEEHMHATAGIMVSIVAIGVLFIVDAAFIKRFVGEQG